VKGGTPLSTESSHSVKRLTLTDQLVHGGRVPVAARVATDRDGVRQAAEQRRPAGR